MENLDNTAADQSDAGHGSAAPRNTRIHGRALHQARTAATQEERRKALVQHVEDAHLVLQESLASLKQRIDASDAGLYPVESLAADLEEHAEMTRNWTEAMSELAKFYRESN